jgi:5-formyltetrahydrofolate cyclo-ligase
MTFPGPVALEPEPSPAERKKWLRRSLRQRMEALTPEQRRRRGQKVVERVLALPEMVSARRIFTCLSFGLEVDTWPLVDELLAQGREVFVPRVERGDPRIYVHPYPSPLRTLSFGLRQPLALEAGGTAALEAEAVDGGLDLALILGLGFDPSGCRLGYGAGYFDRFLQGRPFPAIGLAYDCQLVEALPVEPHDVPMAMVVTESGIHRPARAGARAAPQAGRDREG